MTRFKIWARDYDTDYDWENSRHLRYKDFDFPADEKWVVEAVDSGHEFYYATHEDAINSIYEGSE